MSYSVYLDKQIAFHHLSKEEALERQKEFRQMINAGVKSCYRPEEVTIKYDSI
jgi:hypothetical protein|tara:strand:+ start:586 stop:744 length:159 start_codon:yes stop_codon:yes gene_type:complete